MIRRPAECLFLRRHPGRRQGVEQQHHPCHGADAAGDGCDVGALGRHLVKADIPTELAVLLAVDGDKMCIRDR